jgi:hypothetical protein
MYRALAAACVLSVVCAPTARTQEPINAKTINIGPLLEHFTVVSAQVSPEYAMDGGMFMGPQLVRLKISVKLRAKKDIDTTDLNFQAGFFDKEKHLLQASRLIFQARIPMLKGETINASCTFKHSEAIVDVYPWDVIDIRTWKKPT